MRGVDRLIALRRRGYKPALGVLVTLLPSPCSPIDAWSFPVEDTAQIEVGSDERIDRLDLRPLVGLPVVVHGYGAEESVSRFVSAAVEAGAYSVVGLHGYQRKFVAQHNAESWNG